MTFIPSLLHPLLQAFAGAFTQPTFRRWVLLLVAALLTPGRRTVSNVLRTVQSLRVGHPSSYHRVFSQRRWSAWRLSRTLTTLILTYWVPTGPVVLVGDDTVEEHPGRRVFGKARHRDAVRSSHTFTAYRWGHKWIVVTVLVQFPFATRPWALPVLVALYRSEEWNEHHGRRHKTPPVLLRQLLAVVLHWCPHRRFLLVGDGSYGTHDLARFAHRYHARLTLISRFYARANLYTPPPARREPAKLGRPRTKGTKLPWPQTVVATAPRRRLTVRWYGGGTRKVEIVTGTGQWYKGGHGVVAVRWVFVHDLSGTHRDEYFFTTNVGMTPHQIIELYTGRWSIETTFQELRAYLGLETTRGWTQKTVLRAAPCLFGLFSLVALLYARLPPSATRDSQVTWAGKREVTFSDALTAVRRWLWVEWIFVACGHKATFTQLPHEFRALLLSALAPAA